MAAQAHRGEHEAPTGKQLRQIDEEMVEALEDTQAVRAANPADD
jgi:hypothetical protein